MTSPKVLHFTENEDANRLLASNPFALLVGMLLDQQVPMEWAFRSPFDLSQRLGGELDAAAIAAIDPEKLSEVFSEKPALHRFPGSMAKRTHALSEYLVGHYDGRADAVWADVADAAELMKRLTDLPGFGKEKSRVFVAILARFFDVKPGGWEQVIPDWPSAADLDTPGAIESVREAKRAWKASKKSAKQSAKS